jgi:hypothetical protein
MLRRSLSITVFLSLFRIPREIVSSHWSTGGHAFLFRQTILITIMWNSDPTLDMTIALRLQLLLDA